MVLSHLLTPLLTSILGDYLQPECFQEDSIRVGLWRGHVELFNVCLKDDILDLLDLPITLRFARIGHIEIQIPWNQLGGKPVVVKIEEVHVLAYAKYQWEEAANERRLEAIKQAQLRAAEEKAEDTSKDFGPTAKEAAAAAAAGPAGGAGGGGTHWLMQGLLNQVLDRIQIEIRNVHIRFEDLVSSPSLPYCLGLTLKVFKVSRQDASRVGHALGPAPRKSFVSGGRSSSGGDGTEAKEDKGGKEVLKVAHIEYLSVYCNPVSNDNLVSMALHELEGDEEVDVMLARLLPQAPVASSESLGVGGVGKGKGKVGRRKDGSRRTGGGKGGRADWKEEEEQGEGEQEERENEDEDEDEEEEVEEDERNAEARRQRQAQQDADRLGGHRYLLHPARSTSYFWLGSQAQEPGSSQRTRVMRALLGLDRLTITLEDHLLRSVLCLSAGLVRFQTMNRLGVKRPNKGVGEDPRAWWRYAYEVVLVKLHEHRGKYDWSSVLRRRKTRLRYVKYWKRWVEGRDPRREEGVEEQSGEEEEGDSQDDSEKEEEEEEEEDQLKRRRDRLSRKIKELEARLSYKDILLYRKLAEAQLKEEGVTPSMKPSTGRKGRWWSFLGAADWRSADPAEVMAPAYAAMVVHVELALQGGEVRLASRGSSDSSLGMLVVEEGESKRTSFLRAVIKDLLLRASADSGVGLQWLEVSLEDARIESRAGSSSSPPPPPLHSPLPQKKLSLIRTERRGTRMAITGLVLSPVASVP